MQLETLRPAKGATKDRKRVGRGPGSGLGRTSARGMKGQGSRAGSSVRPGFEGGQMPLQRRLPKRGFTNIFRTEYVAVNITALAQVSAGTEVTPALLRQMGLVKGHGALVKILGEGEAPRQLRVKAHAFSASARQKIEAAGGACEVVPG